MNSAEYRRLIGQLLLTTWLFFYSMFEKKNYQEDKNLRPHLSYILLFLYRLPNAQPLRHTTLLTNVLFSLAYQVQHSP